MKKTTAKPLVHENGAQNDKNELPVISFGKAEDWRNWLEENHDRENGIWLRIYKKGTGRPSVNHGTALDEALCYGWIDGQSKSYDNESYLQKFTPRRPRSTWSKINIEHIERLEKEGKMRPAGRKAVEAAKADGRWERAYDSPRNMEVPEDFIAELSKNEKALEFFETLNKTNRYAVAWRLHTAKKPETRERRKQVMLEMMARGEKFH
ncbi:MAG: YdeI/OmpD-associated family protein [Mangrovibacterium sp.]|nr:YdeI/OmpD-associated family protein [Mangrovibacterium sp.]